MVFDRNGARKGSIVEDEFKTNTTAKKLCFAETNPGFSSESIHNQMRNLPPGSRVPYSLRFLL